MDYLKIKDLTPKQITELEATCYVQVNHQM